MDFFFFWCKRDSILYPFLLKNNCMLNLTLDYTSKQFSTREDTNFISLWKLSYKISMNNSSLLGYCGHNGWYH